MPEAPLLSGLAEVETPGLPFPRVTLRPLTIGGLMRLQRIDAGDPLYPLHLVAECSVAPRLTAAELEALPAPMLAAVNELIRVATEISSKLFRQEVVSAADPPA